MTLIEAMGHRGEGIAREAGKPVYIPYALPGEMVSADVSGERGRLVRVVSPSPDRIAPFCPHHGTCGGCLLQHWAPTAYRDWKRGLVVKALAQRGLAPVVRDLVEAHGEGRRRVRLHVRRTPTGVTAGFMRVRSHAIHDIDFCPILVPALVRAPEIARCIGDVAGDTDAAMTATSGGIDVTLKGARALSESVRLGLAGLARELDLARLSVHGEPLVERAAPLVAMGRALVKLPPVSFLQATQRGEETLAALVIEAVGKARHVADLFCGLGPFALRLAENARVFAADSDAATIDALTRAARAAQGLKPLKAEVRDLFREPLTAAELDMFDAVVLDPPRAGAEAQSRRLAQSQVRRVAMVSCDPASFARDAAILAGGGYALEWVAPVDQFAWSAHVEIVGVFRR